MLFFYFSIFSLMENDSILLEMKGIAECYKKECLRYENIRQIYLEDTKNKGEDCEWVHKRMKWLYGLTDPKSDKAMRVTMCKLNIPSKDKSYLMSLLKYQSLLRNYDPVVINAERIIKNLQLY